MPILLATPAMGTRFELVLASAGDESPPRLRAIGEEALREIELWHERLSRFVPHSDVAKLNRDPSARVHPDTRDLLDLCDRIREASEGAFDIGMGHAMESLGLHPAGTGKIDLGAIGKGFALDRAAAILRENGVNSALLHGGTSSIVAIGEWPVVIGSARSPLPIKLCDQAMGVSQPKARASDQSPAEFGRGDAAHIVDPRTRRPAHAADTAAVIGDSAAMCDAWSTALVVLGSRPSRFPAGYESHIYSDACGWQSARPNLQLA